jgi:hypothetical protein
MGRGCKLLICNGLKQKKVLPEGGTREGTCAVQNAICF